MRFRRSLINRGQTQIGVDIGTSSVKVALMEARDPSPPELLLLERQELPEGAVANGLIQCESSVVRALQKLFPARRPTAARVATALPAQSVVLKKVAFPEIQGSELESALGWEASRQLSVDSSAIGFDYRVLNAAEKGRPTELLLAAARKDTITALTRVIQLAGLTPAVVEVDVNTLHNLYLHSYGSDSETVEAILEIGASTTKLVIFRGASLIFTAALPYGGQNFLDSGPTTVRTKQIPLKKPTSTRISTPAAREIKRSFSLFQTSQGGGSRITRVLLCGGGSRIPYLPLILTRTFEVPVDSLDPLIQLNCQRLSLQTEKLEQCRATFTLAIGLALRMRRER